MTALKALAILEAAVLECKKRNINTLEVRDALNFLEPHTQPPWLILQYRNALDSDWTTDVGREGQQQVLRATFPGIRSSVKELLGKQIDALARRFAVSQDARVEKKSSELRNMESSVSRGCLWRGRVHARPLRSESFVFGAINRIL